MSTTTPKFIPKSSDGESFEVEEAAAMQFRTSKHAIDDCGRADKGFPLPNVAGKFLSEVIRYCEKHAGERTDGDQSAVAAGLKAWDADFIDVDLNTLRDLPGAANYLDIKGLFRLTCHRVADLIKGKTPDEIRKTFNIKNDFTPEGEKEVPRENEWALT